MFFRRKNANRRIERRAPLAGVRRSYLDWMKMGGGTLFLAVLLYGLFHLFVASSHFKISRVEITAPFRHAKVRELAALAGLPAGKNLFFINLYDVGRQISQHPWARHVSVRRAFPHTLSIHLDEFEPVAILDAASGDGREEYYLDSEGVIFKRLEGDDVRAYPKIDGFESGKLKKFPFYYRPQILEALRFLDRFVTLPGNEGFRLASLHHDEAEGYTVTLCRGSDCGKVFFGKEDYAEKMVNWIKFSRMLTENKWFQAVDLHVRGKIFARI